MNGWAVADVAVLVIIVVLLLSERARKPLYLLADWAEDWWLASCEKRRMRADEQASEAAYWRRFGAVPHDAWRSGEGPEPRRRTFENVSGEFVPRVRPHIDAPTLFENRSGRDDRYHDAKREERQAREAVSALREHREKQWATEQLTAIMSRVADGAVPDAELAPVVRQEIELVSVGRHADVEMFDIERDGWTPDPSSMVKPVSTAPAPEYGAHEGWSPLADVRAAELSDVFTPTELLPQRTVTVAIHEPDEDALSADTKSAFDSAFGRVDEYMSTYRQMESTSLWTEDDQLTLAAMLAADDAELSAAAEHRAVASDASHQRRELVDA